MITVRITTFSRISSLLLISLSLFITYTLYMSHLQLNQLSQQNAIFSNMKTLTITTLNQSISAYLNTGNANQLQSAEKVIAQLQSSNTELPMDISSSKLSQQLTSFNVLLKGELRSSGKLANNLIGYYYSMFKLAYRA